MRVENKLPVSRLSGFAVASLWHHRLVRTETSVSSRVRPRLAAELVLHRVRSVSTLAAEPRKPVDAARHAA